MEEKSSEEIMTPANVPDLRGKLFRTKRLMPDAEAREFLRNQKIAHVGTVDGNGWPYVVPLSTSTKAETICICTLALTRGTF